MIKWLGQQHRQAEQPGLAFFVESLPRYLAFPVCGAVCDKISPVRILHISQVYRALACVVAVALYGVFDGIYWIVMLSALCGVLTTQGIMAREVLMAHIFKQYTYAKTLSYSQIAVHVLCDPGASALVLCPTAGGVPLRVSILL